MNIFISWSGSRSLVVADVLRTRLEMILQATAPFLSTDDIRRGKRWESDIGARLAQSNFGIICITADNKNAPWLLFEAGAISKNPDSHVCTYLIDQEPADIAPPLGDFQHTLATKDQTLQLILEINTKLQKPLEKNVLTDLFASSFWPPLEDAIAKAKTMPIKEKDGHRRGERELLEQILAISQATADRVGRLASDSKKAMHIRYARPVGDVTNRDNIDANSIADALELVKARKIKGRYSIYGGGAIPREIFSIPDTPFSTDELPTSEVEPSSRNEEGEVEK